MRTAAASIGLNPTDLRIEPYSGSVRKNVFDAFELVQVCTKCLKKSGPTLEKWILEDILMILKVCFSCLTILEAGPHTTAPSEATVLSLWTVR